MATARKEKALETRRRMLAAAYRLFCERGYAGTTMDLIAKEAEVAVQTLYFTFHTKGAILSETLGAAIVGFERWTGQPPPNVSDADLPTRFMPWWPVFEAEHDAREALAIFVDETVEILRRAGPLASVVHGVADPEARSVLEVGERRRIETYRVVVKALAKKKPALGLSVAKATDVLLVLLSPAMGNELLGRGWTANECRKFLIDTTRHALFHG